MSKKILGVFTLLLIVFQSCSKDENVSNGDGAQTIVVTEEFDAQITGIKGYMTRLGDMDVSFVLPKDTPKQLAVYLHGDGGTSKKLGAVYQQVDYCYKNGIIMVVPTANKFKTRSSTGEQIPSWAKVQDTEGLSAILDAFINQYNVPANTILFQTVSGGSHYYTNEFLHRSGDKYQGSAFIVCGGDVPSGDFLWDHKNKKDLVNKHHLHFDYGNKDFLVTRIELSIDFYTKEGFKVTKPDIVGDELHCGTNYTKGTLDFWKKYTTN